LTSERRDSLAEIARSALSLRMLVAALMGFASGLPLLLTGSVLQAWMKDEGVDLGTIGLTRSSSCGRR
jgi:PAT family beta-lactamase induction signal transducer AmpG